MYNREQAITAYLLKLEDEKLCDTVMDICNDEFNDMRAEFHDFYRMDEFNDVVGLTPLDIAYHYENGEFDEFSAYDDVFYVDNGNYISTTFSKLASSIRDCIEEKTDIFEYICDCSESSNEILDNILSASESEKFDENFERVNG